MTSSHRFRHAARRVAGSLAALLACAGASAVVPSTAAADGMFVAECQHTHRASNDPIVFHGMPGASHRHDFFGNPSTNASSTARSLRKADGRCTPGGDESAYWVPVLTRGGKALKPIRAQIYYNDFARQGHVFPFPTGLRMVAGDARSTKPQPGVVRWSCSTDHGPGSHTIPTCTEAEGHVTLRINFPDCWDGRRLDSPDHASHMAYNRDDGLEPFLQSCPKSHPVLVPQLQVNVFYPMRDGKGVRLASGSIMSAHADFFNAWRPSLLRRQVDTVLNQGKACHPYFGCTSVTGPTGEPVVARPRKRLIDRFYPPRGARAPARGAHAHH